MATLTWQDVAGRVAAPDFNDASAMITEGINTLGGAVRDLGSAPDQRRKAELAKKALLIGAEAGIVQDGAKQMDALGNRIKLDKKEKDMSEFGAAQSILEAGARDAAMGGKSFEDFIKSNETYLKLGEGAKSYGAQHLSDAFGQGLTFKEQQEDNARQERHFQQQFAQQERQFRASEARANRQMNLQAQALGKAEQREREAAGLISKDAQTNIAWRDRAAQLQSQLAPIARGMELYGKISPNEAAEKGGIMNKNWLFNGGQEAQQLAAEIQKKTGKKIDTWMINQLLVEGGNADNARFNPGGNIDDAAAEDYLMNLVKLREAAEYNQRFFDQMTQEIRSGKTYSKENLNNNFPIRTGVDIPLAKPKSSTPKRKPMATF